MEKNFSPDKKKLEKPRFQTLDGVFAEAITMTEFRRAVETAESKFGATKNVRSLLLKHFPEILELPAPEEELRKKRWGDLAEVLPCPPNHCVVAKDIVDRFYKI